MISNSKPDDPWLSSVWVFVKHYLGNIDPRRLFILGDQTSTRSVISHGKPVLLIATLLLLALGIRACRENIIADDSWWRFVIYGAVVSSRARIAHGRLLAHAATCGVASVSFGAPLSRHSSG